MGNNESELLEKIRKLEERCSELEAEQSQTENKLLLAQSAALAAKRSQSHFIANLSHEIRTPMNSILGMGEILQETRMEDEQKMYLDIMLSSSQVLLTILNDLLDFSSIESGNLHITPRTTELRLELEKILRVLTARAEEKNIEFVVHIEKNVPEFLFIDIARLGQILLNLISNAIKFAANRGGVILYISREETEDPNEVRLFFAVTDSGPGISITEIEKVFESFTKGNINPSTSHHGTGLGLTISRNLVQLMGGMIRVNTRPTIGSAFHFTITCEKAAGEHRSTSGAYAQPDLNAPQEPGLGRILLAEDNPIHQTLTTAMLTQAGYQVTVVPDGKVALDTYETSEFDIILLDLDMPVVNGIESARALRARMEQQDTYIPIIALSAGQPRDAKKNLSYFNQFLQKPVSKDDLIQTVAGLLV